MAVVECKKVTLGSNFYLCHSDLARFFEYFGSIDGLALFSEPKSVYKYLVEVLFCDLKGYHQLLSWPFPLSVQGVPLQICNGDDESTQDHTLSQYDEFEQISLFSDPEIEPSICLKVSRIPSSWEAFELFSKMNDKYPSIVDVAMVSEFSDLWGHKQGLVELSSCSVAEKLMQEGECVLGGETIEFTFADIEKIETPSRNSLDSYTTFPWLPRAVAEEEPEVDDMWADLFSPPLAEIDGMTI